MINLFQYFYLYVVFSVIDTSNDDRISFEEFKASIPCFKKWGIDRVNALNAKNIFDEIDTNKGGMILFDEFV